MTDGSSAHHLYPVLVVGIIAMIERTWFISLA
jgi:hypothetical protein